MILVKMSSVLAPIHVVATRINCSASPPLLNSFQLRAPTFPGVPVLAFRGVAPQLRSVSSSPWYRRSAICLFGGKGDLPEKKDSDASLWKSLEDAMGNVKKGSIDDILREQIREQELAGGGGFGGPPRGGDGGDDSSEDGEEDFYNMEEQGLVEILKETLQKILATLGFILMYCYMLYGEDLHDLIEDCYRYSRGYRNEELESRMEELTITWYLLTMKEEKVRRGCLVRAIKFLTTPT